MKITIKHADRGVNVDDYSRLPLSTWFIPHRSGRVFLFVRNVSPDGTPAESGTVFSASLCEAWGARDFFENSRPWTLLVPATIALAGDARPLDSDQSKTSCQHAQVEKTGILIQDGPYIEYGGLCLQCEAVLTGRSNDNGESIEWVKAE